ncbi:Gfo/Idh/MocA family protein [Streptomyces sp. NPDC088197]|uniref:Gfo/Idh/MocA family protein n=1 Tax=Streptomyces sp. NPDC088197 TaxID=3365840 RepID=UPI00382DF841
MTRPAGDLPYRTALIGAGSIADDAHVPAIRALSGQLDLVAVADSDPARAADFAARHGIARGYDDPLELLAVERPDLVVICSPSFTHADLTVAALEAGAWVYCEKPLCGSLADHDRILAAERATGRCCAPVFQWRAGSGAAHVRGLLRDGVLGPPLLALCQTTWYRGADYYAAPWRGRRATELGGATVTQGIHAMDLMLWLMPDWAEVSARIATVDRDIETEDVSLAHVAFASGAQASIVNSVVSARQESYLRIDCARASTELRHLYAYGNEHWTFTPAPDRPPSTPGWDTIGAEVPAHQAPQLADLVARMRRGEPPEHTAADARRTTEFVTALYKSAATGRPVPRGSIGADDPFHRSWWGAPPSS